MSGPRCGALLGLSLLMGFTAPAWGFAYFNQRVVLVSDNDATLTPEEAIPISWRRLDVSMALQFDPAFPPVSASAVDWNDNARKALLAWNRNPAAFTWHVDRRRGDVCNNQDGINTAGFAESLCGVPFGDSLAVTRIVYTEQSDGLLAIRDADVLFDRSLPWDVYDGLLRVDDSGDIIYDFRRVALHEFGHALGLGHPDEVGEFEGAIMHSRISHRFTLTPDDREGVTALYARVTAGDRGAAVSSGINGLRGQPPAGGTGVFGGMLWGMLGVLTAVRLFRRRYGRRRGITSRV